MNRRRAFTLIELLVVVSIIALLASILLPITRKAMLYTKNTICRSNLHQWGIVFSTYSSDNNNRIGRYYFQNLNNLPFALRILWFNTMRPYYRDPKLLLCPLASEPNPEGYSDGGLRWAWHYPAEVEPGTNEYYACSYGTNGWLDDPPDGLTDTRSNRHPNGDQPGEPDYYWRITTVSGAGYIPMLLDCATISGWPKVEASPPAYNGDVADNEDMKRFCMNRHVSGNTHAVFLDNSLRQVGLKELWEIKWHRGWRQSLSPAPSEWPAWMEDFKDY